MLMDEANHTKDSRVADGALIVKDTKHGDIWIEGLDYAIFVCIVICGMHPLIVFISLLEQITGWNIISYTSCHAPLCISLHNMPAT